MRDAGCGMRNAKNNHRDYGIEQNEGLGSQKGPVIDQFGGFLLSIKIKSHQVR